MKVKRRSSLFDFKIVLGAICLLALLYAWSTSIPAKKGEGNESLNKLEDIDLLRSSETDELSFDGFLDKYAKKGFTILLASYDDMKINFKDSGKKLTALGSKYMDSIKFRDSYAGIIKDGAFLEEVFSRDSLVSLKHHDFVINGYGFGKKRKEKTKGGIYYVQDFTEEKVGFTKSRPDRGINILAFKNDGEFIRKTTFHNFDFYTTENPISKGILKVFPGPLEKLFIEIDEKDFDKIKKKRTNALELGLLLTSDEDWVPAKVRFKNKEFKAEVRLKGDWTDHLRHKNKWSYKVKLKDGTIKGTNVFSVQTAAARNYMGEWMFHELLKKEDVIALNYDFLKVGVIAKGSEDVAYNNMGVMAFEESFTKYLLERNERKESVILKINESLGWEDFKKGGRNFGDETLPITAFGLGKILKDSIKYQQFILAKELLHSYYRSNTMEASKIFDYDKFAYWDAVATYTAGVHGHALHNQRFYYNPITSLLEPVGFDAQGYYYVDRPFEVLYSFGEDQTYRNLVLSKLSNLMRKDSLTRSEILQKENYLAASKILTNEYPDATTNLKELMEKRSRKIRSVYNLSHPMDVYLDGIDQGSIRLNFRNVAEMDIEIMGLYYKKKPLGSLPNPIFIKGNSSQIEALDMVEGGLNAFFSKNTKTINRSKFQNIKVAYRIVGADKVNKENVIPYPYHDPEYVKRDIMRKSMDISEFPFVQVNERSKTVNFLANDTPWELSKPIRIDKGYRVIIPKNFKLDIVKGGLIITKSPVFFEGESSEPITIFSSDGKGGGMIVLKCPQKSTLRNTTFDGLSNPNYEKWSVTGAVTFYESEVELYNVTLKNNSCEDALNVVRSHFRMDSVHFENTKSDAFDGDFVTGEIMNSTFKNLGNDAIDVSGSYIMLKGLTISNAGDKAISIGEKSDAIVENTKIQDSEIGINTKDLSITKATGVEIKNTRLAFTAFQKKDEFGAGKIIADNIKVQNVDQLHLIEVNSFMTLNGQEIDQKISGVKDKMYGNQFGRKSER